jgi:hypothetical protein
MDRFIDLNQVLIPDAMSNGVPLGDWHMGIGDVRVHFRNLKDRLIEYIGQADYVFGCVAWFTDVDILEALAQKRGVSILIQKEDFLRPDSPKHTSHNAKIRELYTKLPTVNRFDFGVGVAHLLSLGSDPVIDAVRCVGVHQPGPTQPRMHHKFCVFAEHSENLGKFTMPYAAWTGSFNWSATASRSLENAVYFKELKAVKGFYLEYQQVLALSEPLDWSSTWVEPEWRIGT